MQKRSQFLIFLILWYLWIVVKKINPSLILQLITWPSSFFPNNELNHWYLTESMWIYWLQMFDEYWYEKDTPYPDDFDLWPDWLLKYYNWLPLGESIEISYLMCNSEQHILKPKYDVMHSLVPLVNIILWLWRMMIINSK